MNDKNKFEVKLKSEMYNHDNEQIIKRQEIKKDNDTNKLTISFIIGFILFIIILILIIAFTR